MYSQILHFVLSPLLHCRIVWLFWANFKPNLWIVLYSSFEAVLFSDWHFVHQENGILKQPNFLCWKKGPNWQRKCSLSRVSKIIFWLRSSTLLPAVGSGSHCSSKRFPILVHCLQPSPEHQGSVWASHLHQVRTTAASVKWEKALEGKAPCFDVEG